MEIAQRFVTFAVMTATIVGHGLEVTSSDVFKVASGEPVVRIAPHTVSASSVPDDLPVPLFHFDASDHSRWHFNADGTEVTNIPSTVGSRYLASTLDGGPSKFIANGAQNAPRYLPSVAELGGLPALAP